MKKHNIEPYNENGSRRNFEREEAYLRAKKRVDNIVGFYWHLLVYVLVNIFIIYVIVANSNQPLWNFGTFSTPIFWGIGLAFHWLGVFGKNLVFGKDWEKRQVEKYMEEDKNRWE